MPRVSAALAGLLGLALLFTPARGAPTLSKDEGDIRARLAAYARVRLETDLGALPAREREALARIVAAVKAIDAIYWKQMGAEALAARRAFAATSDPIDALYRDLIAINYGPFDIRNNHERFVVVGSAEPRWPGAGFYPGDMTPGEFEAHLRRNPEFRKEFEKHNTLVRRVDGMLVALPYETIYRDDLKVAARALQEAAVLVDGASLRRYLSTRAEALLGGDYYTSDLAWLDVTDNRLDVVIGPIETYDDALLGLKASYEAAALVKDVAGGQWLEVYRKHLDGISRSLPVDARYRKETTGGGNVLEILNVVRFGGLFNAGIKTVAASLPNDQRVIQEKGAKKQIYRNVLEAKFDAILEPIAGLFLRKREQTRVTREAYVTNVMLHELSHTLGLDYVAETGDLTVRKALSDHYAVIEEAKADALGLFALRYLEEQDVLSRDDVRESYATHLVALLRAARFGTAQAQGRSAVIQLNFLRREKGIAFDVEKGQFRIRQGKMKEAITGLARELLEIEGSGDYARAGALLSELGHLDGAVREALQKTEGLPVDVVFTYPD